MSDGFLNRAYISGLGQITVGGSGSGSGNSTYSGSLNEFGKRTRLPTESKARLKNMKWTPQLTTLYKKKKKKKYFNRKKYMPKVYQPYSYTSVIRPYWKKRLVPSTPEKKFIFQNESTNIWTDNSHHIKVINGPAEGTNQNQRIGKRIRITQIGIKMLYTNDPDRNDGQCVRVMLIWDKRPNQDVSSVVQPLSVDDALLPTTTSHILNRYYNPLTMGNRYKILSDEYFDIEPSIATQTITKCYQKYINCNKSMTFNGTANANITSGALNVLVAFKALDGTNMPNMDYEVKYCYQDD